MLQACAAPRKKTKLMIRVITFFFNSSFHLWVQLQAISFHIYTESHSLRKGQANFPFEKQSQPAPKVHFYFMQFQQTKKYPGLYLCTFSLESRMRKKKLACKQTRKLHQAINPNLKWLTKRDGKNAPSGCTHFSSVTVNRAWTTTSDLTKNI